MQAQEAFKWATQQLKNNKVSEPEKSAEFLLRQVLSAGAQSHTGCGIEWDKAKLIANPDYALTGKQEEQFRQFIARRKKHEPVWYITGHIEFYGLDLEVSQDVLIPRPETEFLVEEVLESIRHKTKDIRILELGTGSGAIALALAAQYTIHNTQYKVMASDISSDALKIAKKNAKRLGLDSRSGSGMTKIVGIEFRQGDLLAPWHGEVFDIIVANLPYIPHEDLDSLALDIHHWEPRVALDGGKEGLEIYERLIKQAKDYLNENYQMFFEIGIGQGKGIRKLIAEYLPEASVEIKKDYGDIDRIAIIKG